MAFEIKHIVGASIDDILYYLHKNLQQSRFTADVRLHSKKITIHDVRLKEKKHYCGNHPYPCPVPLFGGERPHRKGKWLEGADWVAFNDMLNDTFDDLGVSANIASTLVIIRKGRLRCIEYDAYPRGINQWEWIRDNGEFEDRIDKPHEVSGYPDGTPGIDSWQLRQDYE